MMDRTVGVQARMQPLRILATTVGAALLVCGLLFAYASSPAWAAEITVNSLADDADGADGECTLREAITAANTDTASGTATGECAAGSGDDEIHFALPGPAPWTVNLTGELPELDSTTPDSDLTTATLRIEGPGADQFTVRRDTGGLYSIFQMDSFNTVSISGMTITNGDSDGSGGGIHTFGGDLTVTDSTISGNTAAGNGGGILTRGTLTVIDSTISGNTASGGCCGAEGGGIFSDTSLPPSTTKTTITNSTISGNTAEDVGGRASGGGVYNTDGLTVIEFSTITNNTAPNDQGSGVASDGDTDTTTEVLSTIISDNTNTDVDSGTTTNSFVSRGYNLIGDGNATGAFNQTGDQAIGDDAPGLGPLENNGGPTQTHALLSGSPAIDVIPQGTNGCGTYIATDQRGVSRPQGSACDKGSFELEKLDTEAPRVISTFPRDGGEIGPAANIRATFSEDMQETSVINAFKLFRKGSTNQIAAVVTYDAATDTATLNPTNNLRKGATYKAVVSTQAKDEAGNWLDQNSSKSGLQQKVWFFEIDN